MDNTKLEKLLQELQGLDDAEFEKRLQQFAGPDEPEKPEVPEQKISFRLPDGSVVEGTPEDVQRQVQARLIAQQQQAVPQQTQEQVRWDYDQFVERFKKDPRDGLDYADQSQFGVPVRQLVPVLAVGMANLMREVQDLRARELGRQASPEAVPVIEQIIRERGWQPTPQAYEDALTLAQARGLVKGREEQQVTNNTVVPPPRIPRGVTPPENNDEALLNAFDSMSDEDVEKILMARGHITKSHLS